MYAANCRVGLLDPGVAEVGAREMQCSAEDKEVVILVRTQKGEVENVVVAVGKDIIVVVVAYVADDACHNHCKGFGDCPPVTSVEIPE